MTLFELVKQNDSSAGCSGTLRLAGQSQWDVPLSIPRGPASSMKLNERYFYCFGCGATGDVIDLVARLFGLSSFEAAQKLAQNFGIDPDKPPGHRSAQAETPPADGIPTGGNALPSSAVRLSASFRTLEGTVCAQGAGRCFG